MAVFEILSQKPCLLSEDTTEQYECHDYTAADLTWQTGNNASNQDMCERNEGYVFAGGNQSNAPGCVDCGCCKPVTGTS